MNHDLPAATTRTTNTATNKWGVRLNRAASSGRLFDEQRQSRHDSSTKEMSQCQAIAQISRNANPNQWTYISIISAILFTLLNTSHGLQQQQQQQQAAAINWTTTMRSFTSPLVPFGSNRYIYPRNSQEKSNNRQLLNSHYRYDILASDMSVANEPAQVELEMRNQLMEMRKKFEIQLAISSGHRQVTLGSACLNSKDCNLFVQNSHCQLDNYTCSCLSNHVQYNSTTCLPTALLGFKCSIDSQCELRVANSFCSADKKTTDNNNSISSFTSYHDRICSCKSNFIAHRRDKCLQGSQINEYCLSNEQCRLNDQHSYCQWRITNIYGTCKCPANYKQVKVTSKSQTSAGEVRCVPRLGDVCLSDEECQLATPNSSCREEAARGGDLRPSSGFRSSWKSSALSSSKRRCLCQSGFVVSANKLDCLSLNPLKWPEDSELASNFTTTIISLASHFNSTTTTLDKRQHHYDLVTLPTTTSIPEVKTTSTTTTRSPAVSSLGKKCLSAAECRARDPHSDCIGGICECLRPTSKCRANSTGCHADTFQCRNGQCISWYFVCDQFRNCADGSDEDECQWADCPPEAFQCSNGHCLARSKVCNGRRDCSDGSDEFHCAASGPALHLPDDQTSSKGSSSIKGADWLSPQAQAEAEAEARGGEAAKNSTGCHPKVFTCSNGQCLPAYVFCNAVQDCSDGSDEREQFCERHQTLSSHQNGTKEIASEQHQQDGQARGSSSLAWQDQTSASNNKKTNANTLPDTIAREPIAKAGLQLEDSPLVKADRLDINKMLASLRLPARQQPTTARTRQELAESRSSTLSVRRRSRLLTEPARRRQQKLDEQQRQLPVDAKECPRGSFTCANGKCRSTAILCSGVDGCGDNSDENQCEVCQCEAV